MAPPKKVLGKLVQLYAGVDMIGTKTTINYRDAEILVLPHGVLATSKKTKRQILIYASNIKAVEIIPTAAEEITE